jgi:TPR repeat protein
MTRFLSITLLSFCIILPVYADIYSASNALSRGDYDTAVKEFTKLAEKGDANAQANLGYMYYAGEGVPQDYEKAVYWYRKAATQGNKDAQYNLAVSYAFGEGVKQDLTEAAIWYRRAGEQGHIVSQYSLGISYAYGEGVPQDQKEAARWFKKAADQGYARAQVHMGSMYHTGEGVKQDYSEAVRWYRLAADRGDATAQYNLGAMYRSGKGVEQNYAQAKRWFRQSADQGYAAAQNELASLERSAAANVATRTIQAKPEIPIVKEEIPEPIPATKKEVKKEPVEEKVVVQETKPVEVKETPSTTAKTDNAEKKPLFSVEKEGLLSLDDSQLDIAEPEVTPETIEEPVAKETVTQTEQIAEPTPIETKQEETEVEVVDSSGIQKALGVATPKETEEESEVSEGFFSKLFSKKEEPDTGEAYLFDQEEIAAEYASDKYIEKVNDESTTDTKTTDDSSNDVTQVEESIVETVEEKDAEIKTPDAIPNEIAQTDKENETEKSEGFFSKLFSKKEKEPDTGKAYLFDQEEIAAEYASDKYIEKVNDESTTDDTSKEVIQVEETEIIETEPEAIAEVTESPSNNNAINNALGLPAQKETEEEPETSEGFFSKLFERNNSTEPEEEIAAVIDEESENNIVETPVYQEEEIEDEVIAQEENQVEETIEAEATEEKEGFFSRLFSSDEDTDSTFSESEDEIAAVEYEESVVEEVKTIDTEPEDIAAATETTSSDNAIHNALGVPESTDNDIVSEGNDSSESFFDKLFSTKETNDTVSSTEEAVTEATEQEAVIEEVEEKVIPEPEIIEDETTVADNNWAESETTEEESSGGLFSAIGDFFSGKDKSTETNVTHETSDNEEVIIAKVEEEPVSIAEEIELTDQAETNLNQYSIASGRIALAKNDYDEAYKQFQHLADAGDSEAQSHLGSLYYVGKGAPKDFEKAYHWYKKAAEQGNIDAQYSMGNMYLLGEGVEQSNTDAAKWYAQASEQGHRAAENNLKNLERLNELNRENQLKLDAIAADQNDNNQPTTEVIEEAEEVITTPDDQAIISDTSSNTEEKSSGLAGLFDGLFGDKSSEENAVEEQAEEIAIEQSNEVAVVEIDTPPLEQEQNIISESSVEDSSLNEEDSQPQNNVVANEPTETPESDSPGFFSRLFGSDDEDSIIEETSEPTEVALAEDIDIQSSNNIDEDISEEITAEVSDTENLRTLATQGDKEAQYKLGTLFYSGSGEIKQDYSQAALWYRRAAQQGNAEAQYNLGNMFLMGEGVTQNDIQAAQWYSMAAEQGHTSAKHNLENLQKVQTTDVVQIESSETNQLISLDDKPTSATQIDDNTGKAEYEQGLAYAFGDGVPQNDRNAFNLFYEAAEKGYVLAQYKVGVAFAYGEGVRQDNKQAVEWYRKAAEQGYTIAQRNLATMYLDGNGVEQNKVQALAWYQVVANAGNAMDLRRRDMLKKELSEVELSESQRLAEQISTRITNPSL